MLGERTCIAVVQARCGSTRLPGKVFEDIGGRTLLERVLAFVDRVDKIDDVYVATTTHPSDDAIEIFCQHHDRKYMRGSIDDVWSRFASVCESTGAHWIVRVCADNPYLDVRLADALLEQTMVAPGYDFYSYQDPGDGTPAIRTHYGLFVEVCTAEALLRVPAVGIRPDDREHVTKVFYDRSDIFSGHFIPIPNEILGTGLRMSIDTARDLQAARSVLEILGHYPAEYSEIITAVRKNPVLKEQMALGIRENRK